MLRTARANTERPPPFHEAFLAAAGLAGFALLSDPNDPARPRRRRAVSRERRRRPALERGVRLPRSGAGPAEPRRSSGDTLVDRVDARRIAGDGSRRGRRPIDRGRASSSLRRRLLLARHPPPQRDRPRGRAPPARDRRSSSRSRSASDCSTTAGRTSPGTSTRKLHAGRGGPTRGSTGLFEAHVRREGGEHERARPGAGTSTCSRGSTPRASARVTRRASIVFHMKPLSHGPRASALDRPDGAARSSSAASSPTKSDLAPLLEGIELARAIAATEPLDGRPRTASSARAWSSPSATCARRSATTSTRPAPARSAAWSTPMAASSGSKALVRRRRVLHADDPAGEHEPDDRRDRRAHRRRPSDCALRLLSEHARGALLHGLATRRTSSSRAIRSRC